VNPLLGGANGRKRHPGKHFVTQAIKSANEARNPTEKGKEETSRPMAPTAGGRNTSAATANNEKKRVLWSANWQPIETRSRARAPYHEGGSKNHVKVTVQKNGRFHRPGVKTRSTRNGEGERGVATSSSYLSKRYR